MRCTVVVSRFVVVFSFLLIIVAHCTAGKNQSPFISIANCSNQNPRGYLKNLNKKFKNQSRNAQRADT
jgi:hypothetical protein